MSTVSNTIQWSEQLATGITEIDRQHRFLINAINEANHTLHAFPDPKLLEQITKDLLGYAIYHFETEEDLMQEHGYAEESTADAELHQKQHRDFSAQVIAVRNDLVAGKEISVKELLDFLNDWLVNHIMNTDQRLAAFIRNKQAA